VTSNQKPEIYVHGKPGCDLCDAAKEKLARLGLAYTFVNLESAPTDAALNWRATGCAEAMAHYAENGKLPVIVINGAGYAYAAAMKRLKKMRKKKEAAE